MECDAVEWNGMEWNERDSHKNNLDLISWIWDGTLTGKNLLT